MINMNTQAPAALWGREASNSLLQLAGVLDSGSRWHSQLRDLSAALAWASDTLDMGCEPTSPAPDSARADA